MRASFHKDGQLVRELTLGRCPEWLTMRRQRGTWTRVVCPYVATGRQALFQRINLDIQLGQAQYEFDSWVGGS